MRLRCLFGKHDPVIIAIHKDRHKYLQRCTECGMYQIYHIEHITAQNHWIKHKPKLNYHNWYTMEDIENKQIETS